MSSPVKLLIKYIAGVNCQRLVVDLIYWYLWLLVCLPNAANHVDLVQAGVSAQPLVRDYRINMGYQSHKSGKIERIQNSGSLFNLYITDALSKRGSVSRVVSFGEIQIFQDPFRYIFTARLLLLGPDSFSGRGSKGDARILGGVRTKKTTQQSSSGVLERMSTLVGWYTLQL
jgi:hypothetical protein